MQEAADPGLKRDRFRLLPTERPRQQTGIAPRRQTECSVIDLGPVCIDGRFNGSARPSKNAEILLFANVIDILAKVLDRDDSPRLTAEHQRRRPR
jgi:hypothetical protein